MFSIPVTELSLNTTSGLASQSILYKLSASRITSAQTIASSSITTLIWNNVVTGNAADFNTSTGTWTCPKTGYYTMNMNYNISNLTAGDGIQMRLTVNGTTVATLNNAYPNSSFIDSFGKTNIYIEAGQTAVVTADSQSDTSYDFTNNTGAMWDIQEVPFATTALQTNLTYAARARDSTSRTVTDGNTIIWDSAFYDPYGIINTSTGTITFPVKGVWVVKATAQTNSVAASVGNTFSLNIRDITNGVSSIDQVDICENTSSRPYVGNSSKIFRANAGDQVQIWFSETLPAVTLNPGSSRNVVEVYKLGD